MQYRRRAANPGQRNRKRRVADTLHVLVERYGLLAVFVGCLAEGESAAMLAGFFVHQRIFVGWQAFAVAFTGAFLGDTALFLLGRRLSGHHYVQRVVRKPGFSHAHRLVNRYPNAFVLANRFLYGLRTVGGVAVGMSAITLSRFLILNAISALAWVMLFGSLGYFFALGAEKVIGAELVEHQRLLIGIAAALALAIAALVVARHVVKGEKG